MLATDRPKLRPYLRAAPEDPFGQRFLVHDMLRLSRTLLPVNPVELEWLRLFDGERTLGEIQAAVVRSLGGQLLPLEHFTDLARRLEQAQFLDGPAFRELAARPTRAATHAESYGGDAETIRRSLDRLFAHPRGAGLPRAPRPDDRLCAVLAPHIDYGRGGLSYTYAFKELYERSPAALFVIIGTSHYSRHRFTLTRKHFQTPLGVVPTDQTYIDRLVQHHGPGLFDDELMAHLPEHSIELEVVFLQYLYAGKRDIRIVPLVVGSFHDCIYTQQTPGECPDIRRMVEALQAVERETAEPICYVISGDLAHIGPDFGDRGPLHQAQLYHSRNQDIALLERAERGDAERAFDLVRGERDGRRICGLPPSWLVLSAARPKQGRVLHYDQYVHPAGQQSVSFASMVFER